MLLHLKSNYVTSHLRPFRKKKKKKDLSVASLLLGKYPNRPCVVLSWPDLPCSLAIILSLYLAYPLSSLPVLLHDISSATGPLHIPYARGHFKSSTPVPLFSKWHELYATGVCKIVHLGYGKNITEFHFIIYFYITVLKGPLCACFIMYMISCTYI